MPSRLAASILAFCIDLPMCGCCFATLAPMPNQQHTSCQPSPQTQSQTPSQGQDQPRPCCATHGDSRDTAETLVAIPAPQLKLLPATIWPAGAHLLSVPFPAFRVQSWLPRQDHGPPGVTTLPLFYTQHSFDPRHAVPVKARGHFVAAAYRAHLTRSPVIS